MRMCVWASDIGMGSFGSAWARGHTCIKASPTEKLVSEPGRASICDDAHVIKFSLWALRQ